MVIFESWISALTLWVSGTQLGWSGLVAKCLYLLSHLDALLSNLKTFPLLLSMFLKCLNKLSSMFPGFPHYRWN